MDTVNLITREPPVAPTIRNLGIADYEPTWCAMQTFTAQRNASTADEIWLLQHPPVYTQGLAGKPEHLLRADTGIPVVKIDRGGQITYHGPGQLVAYLLLDIKRRGLSVRPLVRKMETAVINLLGSYGISARHRADAPGVYVTVNETVNKTEAKIAALGLRIKNGCCYHGLALNIDMDLTPFDAINPCGYAGLKVTQLADLGVVERIDTIRDKLAHHLLQALS
ncbi:MAG: lipoyl(octanoyl) transferase LipB [Burkholderiales bacterium]